MESTPYFQYLIPARFKTNSTPPPACPQNFPAEKRPPLLFVARAQHLGLCTRQNPGLISVARFWSVQRKSQGLNIHKSGMMVNMTWLSPAEREGHTDGTCWPEAKLERLGAERRPPSGGGKYEDLNILRENYRLASDDEWEVEIEF